jgi:cell division protein FtsI/penicillin-binding protein 2
VNRWFQYRCIILCAAMVAGLSVLSARLIQIQLVNRHQLAERSRKAYERKEILPALRGRIVDRNEETLARSVPMATLFVDKNHLEDPKLASHCLAYLEASSEPGWSQLDPVKRVRRVNGLRAEILDGEKPEVIVEKHLAHAVGVLARQLGMRREDLRKKIVDSPGKWVPIAKDIPEDEADQIREIVDRNRLQGFDFENSLKRWYNSPRHATHLLGYTRDVRQLDESGTPFTAVKGAFGIEAAMDEYLVGINGWRMHRRDQRGLVVPGDAESLKPPRAGLNVKLTIDMGLQSIVEEELDAALAEFLAARGAVVLMAPKTGDILAMASRPHYDLNHKQDLEHNSFNYAIQGVYEPGSTIKVVATSGALNAGLVSLGTQVFCHNGYFKSGEVVVKDDHPAGFLPFVDVLKKSNNIGSYMMGRKLGSKAFYEHLAHLGFGRKTGIQLSGESAGIARNTNNAVDFSRACYGYSLNVTPLQMACAYSVIAGDGRLLKPRVVDSILTNDGFVYEDFPTETVCQALSPRAAAQMREALTAVTEKGGTATRAAVPGFKVAGKTGTAKKSLGRRGYSDQRVVSFVGMMPAQDPAFVCVVVIDEPKTETVKRQGGWMAAPTFAKIATRVAGRMNLQPTEPIPDPDPLAATTTAR